MNADEKKSLSWSSPTTIVGVLVLVAFSLLVIFMIGRVASSDAAWNRLVYLYGSVEAIVFAAAGAIFGSRVQRAQTEDAEARAKKAQDKADQTSQAATNGRALADAIRAERGHLEPADAKVSFAERLSPTTPQAAAVSVIGRLEMLADKLFPPP